MLDLGPVNIVNISSGAKINVWRNLLLTANVAFKANDPGLRAKVILLGALSYSFQLSYCFSASSPALFLEGFGLDRLRTRGRGGEAQQALE